MLRTLRFCLALSLISVPLAATEVTVGLSPSETEVGWTLGDVLHTVHGTFRLKSGELRFDPETGRASGQFVVDVASGESGSAARDKRMHREILESAKYPEAIFTADHEQGSLAPTGQSHLTFHGTFRIHGQDHEITLPAVVERSGDDVTAAIQFVIPYVRWGMKNPSNFLLKVNDHVEVDVKAKAHLK